jgi:HD-GYP domain-containing protein (c-di-GMP phosphodiesterase class II)
MATIFEISEEQKLQLAALFEVGKTIISSLDEEEVLHRILSSCAKVMGAKICTMRMLNRETDMLELVAAEGMAKEFLEELEDDIALGESVVGKAVLNKRPYPVVDIQQSPYKYAALAREHNLRSLLSVPIILHGEAIGGLTIYTDRPHAYDQGEMAVMESIAGQAAIAIENAKLYQDVIGLIVSLNKIMESKDKWFRGHAERVTNTCLLVGAEINLPARTIRMIQQIVPLHDLGKISVDINLLNKPGPLTDEERAIVRQHVIIGEEFLKAVKLFHLGLKLVRNHHENLDGTGYPDGLKGDEIPREVRLLTIADAWDAITADAPHRPGKGAQDAIEELKRGSGTQFDPEILDAFITLVLKDKIKAVCGRR